MPPAADLHLTDRFIACVFDDAVNSLFVDAFVARGGHALQICVPAVFRIAPESCGMSNRYQSDERNRQGEFA